MLADQGGLRFPDHLHRRRLRGWRLVLDKIRRPVLAWIVAVGVLAGFAALLGVDGPRAGKTTAQNPVPIPALIPALVTDPSSQASPVSPVSPSANRHKRRAAPHRSGSATVPVSVLASASAPAPVPRPSASRSKTAPALQVRYIVSEASGTGFEGEIEVINNGRQPLFGWDITVSLEGDRVTSVQNAAGFVANGILLMQPLTSAEAVPPDGGTLRVFFTASGPESMPLACTFNGIDCQ